MLKVWDIRAGSCLDSFPLNNQPVSLVAHPKLSLLAEAWEGSVAVLKLYIQKPVYSVYKHHLYYIRDKEVIHVNTDKKKATTVLKFAGIKNMKPIQLSYNPSEHALIINFSASGLYRFITFR